MIACLTDAESMALGRAWDYGDRIELAGRAGESSTRGSRDWQLAMLAAEKNRRWTCGVVRLREAEAGLRAAEKWIGWF